MVQQVSSWADKCIHDSGFTVPRHLQNGIKLNPEELLVSHADGRREILDRASSVNVTNMRRYNRFKAGHPAGFIEAFANLYSDIADGLRQYQATGQWESVEVFSADLALEGLLFLEAMKASVESKAWQRV